jgi:hypothetical protein
MSCAHEPLRRWWFFQHFAVKFTVACWHLMKSAAKKTLRPASRVELAPSEADEEE